MAINLFLISQLGKCLQAHSNILKNILTIVCSNHATMLQILTINKTINTATAITTAAPPNSSLKTCSSVNELVCPLIFFPSSSNCFRISW